MTILTTRLTLLSAVVAAAVACAFYPCARAAPPPLGISSRATVVRVVDGDTIDVEIRKVVRVRLRDCWAAELHGTPAEKTRGELAKKFCEKNSLATQGILFVPTDGSRNIGDVTTLGRVLGYYWSDGSEKSLSELMVESGYATKSKPKD